LYALGSYNLVFGRFLSVQGSAFDMRITFLLGGLNMTGGTKVISIYAELLRQRGHDIHVVSRGIRKPSVRTRIRSAIYGVPVPRANQRPQSFFDNARVSVTMLDDYRPIVDADVPDADIVVATWWETAEWMARLSQSKGTKTHFIQCQEGYPLFKDPELIARAASVYRQPYARITISESLINWLHTQHGCHRNSISLIPNSVDTNQFHAPERGKQTDPTVGLLYHFDPTKGLDVSLKALEIVANTYPNLRIISFGSYQPTSELPLPARCTFFCNPPQAQIREIYSSCDVWLCGSRIEGFHLPPIEAMACRCPVVSTRVGGPDQIIINGVNGYLVDVDDIQGLAARLLDILGLPETQWRDMSHAAYKTTQGYNWDQATDMFEEALTKSIQGTA